MDFFIRAYMFLTVLMVVISIGLIRFRSLDTPGRLLLTYICLAWIVESLAFYYGVSDKDNRPVYRIGGIAELFVIILYFNFAVDVLKKKHTGIAIGICAVVIGVLNNFYLQPRTDLASYFISFQSLLVIAMSMLSLARLVNGYDYREMLKKPELWVSLVFLIYFTVTYFIWAMLNYFGTDPGILQQLMTAVTLMNCLANAAFGIIFFRYPKLNSYGSAH